MRVEAAGEAEELPRQFGRLPAGGLGHREDIGEQTGLRIVRMLRQLTGQAEVAEDGGEEVVEIVGDAACQMGYGVHLLLVAALRLGAALLRAVPADADDAGDAVGAEDRRLAEAERAPGVVLGIALLSLKRDARL